MNGVEENKMKEAINILIMFLLSYLIVYGCAHVNRRITALEEQFLFFNSEWEETTQCFLSNGYSI